jgi:hypothetical protein
MIANMISFLSGNGAIPGSHELARPECTIKPGEPKLGAEKI